MRAKTLRKRKATEAEIANVAALWHRHFRQGVRLRLLAETMNTTSANLSKMLSCNPDARRLTIAELCLLREAIMAIAHRSHQGIRQPAESA